MILTYPIILNAFITPGIDHGLILGNYLAITYLAATILAIVTAISYFFNNKFAAFFATLGVLFFLWIVNSKGNNIQLQRDLSKTWVITTPPSGHDTDQ
jgi:hypothetical protein